MTRSSLLIVAILGLLPGPIASQDFDRDATGDPPAPGKIVGRVTEEGRSNRGISDVEVTLLGPGQPATVTNGGGRFELEDVEPGLVEIRFTHLGYAPRTTTLVVQSEKTVEVNVPMSTQPIELEGIEVTVRSAYLERNGFYRRARRGFGRQFTSADLDAINAVFLSDVLFRVPGVDVRYGRNGAQALNRRYRSFRNPDGCRMGVYLDNVPMRDFDLDMFSPWNLEAVEVYRGISTPVFYGGLSPCGVILLWSKR
jgi:hypothetical protein